MVIQKHITEIRVGDVVRHAGKDRTVGILDIKQSQFMGTTLFGDSYNLGYKQVEVVVIERAIPSKGGAL